MGEREAVRVDRPPLDREGQTLNKELLGLPCLLNHFIPGDMSMCVLLVLPKTRSGFVQRTGRLHPHLYKACRNTQFEYGARETHIY
jgi:hypothetical protein